MLCLNASYPFHFSAHITETIACKNMNINSFIWEYAISMLKLAFELDNCF